MSEVPVSAAGVETGRVVLQGSNRKVYGKTAGAA